MNTPDAARTRTSRFAFLSAIPLVAWIVIAISTLGVVGGVAVAVNASGAEPAVGLYWQTNTDPTAGGGVAAPLWQLLWRTDAPSVYFKSGAANTAWTKVGSGTASGGTVTSITAGTGLTATPNPITATGTIAITNTAVTPGSYTLTDLAVNQQGQITSATSYAGSSTGACGAGNVVTAEALSSAGALTHTCTPIGTAGGVTGTGTSPDLTVWSSSTAIGNYAGSSPTACTAGNVVTGSALSAAGALTQTCTAIGTAGGVTGSGTSGTSARFTGTTAIGNGSWGDTGGALTTSSSVGITGATTLGSLAYTTQTNNSTTTINDQAINATTTVFQWGSGAAANVTFTGFTGGATGRVLIIENVNSTNQVSLSNLTGSSAGNQLLNLGNTTAVLKGLGSSATYVYDGSQWRMTSISSTQYDALITFNNSSTVFKGATFTLATQGTTVAASTGFQASGSSSHYVAKISSAESVTCGSNPVVLATDNAGTITIGTSSSGNCTVNFGVAYTTNAPGCVVRFRDQATNSAFVYTTSTTALTITGASDGKIFDYFCWGSA